MTSIAPPSSHNAKRAAPSASGSAGETAHSGAAASVISDGNRLFWAREAAPHFYAGRSALYPPEHSILRSISADCHGRPILDLGVGAGRTTSDLLAVSSDYLGIDYSLAMIRHCRDRFPGVTFQQGDVRDLGGLPRRHYALIMFSFNGLDYIPQQDRLTSLRGLRELLADDGWLVFSSHNRLHRVLPPWHLRNLTAGPLAKLPGRIWAYCQGLLAYRANRLGQYEAQDHAVRIDNCFNYELLTYYISLSDQLAQLKVCGFAPSAVYGMNGERTEAADSADDSWLYYTARRGA